MDSLTTFDPSETVRPIWILVSVRMLLMLYAVWLHHHQRYSPQEGMFSFALRSSLPWQRVVWLISFLVRLATGRGWH